MVTQLLLEMDTLRTHAAKDVGASVVVLAATNVIDAIDPAFLQPGRFENTVHVGLPDDTTRTVMLVRKHLILCVFCLV